jgi:hypothetical protein
VTTFLIWSLEHDAWWAPHGCGYTRELAEAGRYDEAQARGIVTRGNLVHNAVLQDYLAEHNSELERIRLHECLVPVECVEPYEPIGPTERLQYHNLLVAVMDALDPHNDAHMLLMSRIDALMGPSMLAGRYKPPPPDDQVVGEAGA